MSMEWEWIPGYDNTIFTDAEIFEIDHSTKEIEEIEHQILVSGEDSSQFIRFEMPRFYDGVDLSEKTIQILYLTEGDVTDINMARCVQRNDEKIRFGWVVPYEACYDVGTLSFSIEVTGTDYVWKSRTYDLEVYDGLNGGEIVPEPSGKAWYIELQSRCDYVLDAAENAQEAAESAAAQAATSESVVLGYVQDAEDSATTAAEKMAAAEDAQEAAEAAQAAAEEAAQEAQNVFAVEGGMSASVDPDTRKVTLFFTVSE